MTELHMQRNRRATKRFGPRSGQSSSQSTWTNEAAILAAILAGAIVLLLSGCQAHKSPQSAQTTSSPTKQTGVRTEHELGPVRVTVEVLPAPARLSDEPTLTITVVAKSGVDVELPPFGEAVGDFVILDFREPLVEVRGDRVVTRQVYSLEPPRTGRLEIDPITVTFTDQRPDSAPGAQTLETEALSVEVFSLLDAEVPSLDQLQGFEPPVELPATILWWPWLAGATFLIVATVIGVILVRRRRVRASQTPERSPREIAADELQRIWQEQLHLHDIKQFYTELTGIVRRYIEGTVGVRAPEQTTEEFLREISGGHVFSQDERQRLRDFLESSDLVKFAAHEPDREDIDDAFKRARVFVGIDGEKAAMSNEADERQVATHD